MKNLKQRKAFTVVEMVIVIAVIAILATVLIPTISGVIQKANHSTDVQFAASLNIQLALWEVDNGAIESESDLRNAINEYYGAKDENGELLRDDQGNLTPEADYYSTLSPKSGKYGYHFWYDVENKQVVVEKYEDLLPDPAAPATVAEETKFDTASLRCLSIGTKYYLFMDQAGSELAEVISGFETLANAQGYEDRVNAVVAAADDEDNDEKGAYAALETKLSVTTIVTDGGAFRYSDVSQIEQVLISSKATLLQQTKVYLYDAASKTVNDGNGDQTLAKPENVTEIELPANVKVSLGGLNALNVDTYTDETNRPYSNTTKLHVNVTDVEDLENIFTDCVLVMPNGSSYIYLGTELYKLPIIVDEDNNVTNESVGGVNSDVMGGEDIKFDIECNEVSGNPGEGKAYLHNDVLYVAYDKGSVQLSLTDGVTNGMVNWTSDNEELATVDGNGNVTFETLPGTKAGDDYDVVITATYKYNTENKKDIRIIVVRPTTVPLTIGGQDFKVYNSDNKIPVTIKFTGDNINNPIVMGDVNDIGYNYKGYVVTDECELVFATSGNLFKIENNNLVIDEDALSTVAGQDAEKRTQDLTITYQVKNNADIKYITITYAITIEDNSAVSLKPNLIVDQNKNGILDTGDTQIGDNYLFRVGNENTFKLSDLFHAETSDKKVEIIGVKIYDKIKGNNIEISKDTKDYFSAVYTANATDWKQSTIKFGGTGVAVIEVETSKGKESVAVEVVAGKNITAGTYSSLSGNVVLLSDITLTGAFNYNNSTLYGNGFTIDASSYKASGNGMITINNTTLDHVSIVGKDYPRLETLGSNDYYSSLVVISGGDCNLLNSYFRGTRSPVWMKAGTLTIKDTVCDGGTLAALHISGGTSVILDNVTLKQEVREGKLGAGILVDESAPSSTKINIINGFTPYTWFAKSDVSKLPDDFQRSMESLFGDSYSSYHHSVGGVTKINMGIIYESDPSVAKPVYSALKFNTISMSGGVKIYTIQTDTGEATKELYDVPGAELKATYSGVLKQGATKPTYVFNTIDGYEANKNDGETPYYEYSSNEKTILIGFENGKSLTFDLLNATSTIKRLSLTKYGKDCFAYVNVVVKDANGNNVAVTDGKVTFSTEGTYTVIYSFDDPYQYDSSGVVIKNASVHHEWKETIKVTPFDPKAKNAEFTFTGFTGTKEVTIGGKIYVMPDVSTGSADTYAVTVNGQTVYAPLIEGKDDGNGNNDTIRYYQIFGGVTIKDGDTTYNTSTQTFPSAKLACVSRTKVSGRLDKGGELATATPSYQKNYGGLCYVTGAIGTDVNENSIGCPETVAVLGFAYTDDAGKTVTYYIAYHFQKQENSGSCLAAGTMITLADGSKKAVEDLRKGDLVMSFDHLTGEITYKDVIIVVKTAAESYYKNTFVFDDGTELVTINEHGIFDLDLNKYVNIDHLNCEDYLGHSFVSVDSEGNLGVKKLVDVKTVCEGGYKYDIVTNGTLNYVAEDTLSVTHVLVDVINSFDFGEELKYDAEKMQADIEKYGLYDYAEWEEYCDISVFDQYNIPVMKVGISKGLYTKEYIVGLINTYVLDDSVQIID